MSKKVLSGVCFFVRYTIMFILFAILHITSFSSSSVTPEMLMDLEYMIPVTVVLMEIAFFLFVFPAFYSLTRTFAITDPRFNKAVSENKEGLQKFTEKAAFVLTTPYIYFELLIVSFFFTVTSYATIFVQIHTVIPPTTPKLLVTLMLIAGSFLMSLLARISAIKELCYKATFEEIKFGRADRKFGIWYLVRNCVLLSFIYPIAVIMIPYMLAIAAVPFLFNVKDTLTILFIIAAIILLLVFMKNIKAFFKRRKFLRKLKKFCKKNKYILEDQRYMTRSVFKEHDGANFVIKVGGKRYACKMVASKTKGNPLYFTENGELYEVKTRSFNFIVSAKGMGAAMMNNMNISKSATVTSFAFESEYPKLIIVNPVPARLFVGHPDHSMPIDVGSRVGEYRIYNASGFMNAIERDCVER